MTSRLLAPFALAAAAALATALPAAAAEPGALFGGYWADFCEHWIGVFKQQNGVVMGTIGFGVVCLFIITRGKWRK